MLPFEGQRKKTCALNTDREWGWEQERGERRVGWAVAFWFESLLLRTCELSLHMFLGPQSGPDMSRMRRKIGGYLLQWAKLTEGGFCTVFILLSPGIHPGPGSVVARTYTGSQELKWANWCSSFRRMSMTTTDNQLIASDKTRGNGL